MSDETFPFSRFSPAIQKMCRLEFPRHAQFDAKAPIDYKAQFSLTSEDIPTLLEIAGWMGREMEITKTTAGCRDATLHAWKALSCFEPVQVVPQLLDLLNRIKWDTAADDLMRDVLGTLGKCSVEKAKEADNASLDVVPLFLAAIKEQNQHSKTRMVLSEATCYMTFKLPEYSAAYHQILLDDLKELRIDCRDWYAEIVCELAFTENPSPELVALINKACREGYAETYRYWENDGLIDNFGFDFDNDSELLALHKKSNEAQDVLRAFQHCENKFPYSAVQKARELRDWIIPNLIEAVREATAYARFHVQTDDGTVQFAVHLLAEFQAKEALPAILDSFSLTNDELWDYMYGDGVFEAMPGILNRLIGDVPEFYDQKLRDPQTTTALKMCLLQTLRYTVARKVISVETYGSWLRDYLELAIQSKNMEVVTNIVCDILDTANTDYIPIVRSAFEKGLVDECMINLEHAERELNGQGMSIWKMLPDPKRDFSDAVEELSAWAWFQETPSNPTQLDSKGEFNVEKILNAIQSLGPSSKSLPPKPFPPPPNPFPNVGRNDLCPCGSGKKYKVCCLKKS